MSAPRYPMMTTWLWLLTTLFCIRVLMQLFVAYFDTDFLPAFDRWHSGTMPYGLLLFFQILIILVMVRVNVVVGRPNPSPRIHTSRVLFILGSIYLVVMLLRWVLGMTLFDEHRWFTNRLTTFYHLVLALWVLSVGMLLRGRIIRP